MDVIPNFHLQLVNCGWEGGKSREGVGLYWAVAGQFVEAVERNNCMKPAMRIRPYIET